jgi:NAD(P)H-dependent FMN reductase
MPRLLIIVASTRPGRVGKPVANWFVDLARADGSYDIDVADLAEIGLPFLDEPAHPMKRDYRHEHTRRWSERVERADAFVFVMPEYNFGYSAPLKNAIDYLYWEWQDKPVGFVSYGGIAGGTRAVQMIKQVVTTLKMFPVKESVIITFVAERVREGLFHTDDRLNGMARDMLSEIDRLSRALTPMRSGYHSATG